MATLTLQPDATAGKDSRVNSAAPDTSYPTDVAVGIGLTNFMLLKFDISAIEPGSTINSATLYLRNTNTRTSNRTYYVMKVLQDWDENCTWNYAKPSTTVRWLGDVGNNGGTDAGCSVVGTDHSTDPIGTVSYTANSPIGTELPVTLDVAAVTDWLTSNNGVIIRAATSDTALNLATSDHTTASYRPRLVIDYTEAGVPSDLTATDVVTGAPVISRVGANLLSYTDGYGGDVFTAKDAQISSNWPTDNGGGHPNLQFEGSQRSLMQFDLSGLTNDNTIFSATLYLYHSYAPEGARSPVTVPLHAFTAANGGWNAGTKDITLASAGEVTWNARAADGSGGVQTAWAGSAGASTSGVDYVATPIGYLYDFDQNSAIGTEYKVELDPEAVADWLGESNTNYGFIFISPANTGHVAQSSNSTTGYRPKLVVLYNEPITAALTIAGASSAHTSGTAGVTQDQTLSITGVAHGHLSDAVEISAGTIDLTLDSTAHAQISETLALTQVHAASIDQSTLGHLAGTGALTSAQQVLVVGLTQAHTAGGAALTQAQVLGIDSVLHGESAGNAALTQGQILVTADTFHVESVGSAALTQAQALSISGATSAHTAGTLEMNSAAQLDVQAGSSAHSVGTVALAQTHVMGITADTHAQTTGTLAVSQVQSLSGTPAVHTHTAGSVELETAGTLNISSATSAHAANTAGVTQVQGLTIAAATEPHTADSVAFGVSETTLTIANASMQQTAGGAALVQAQSIQVGNVSSGQLVGSASIVQAQQLSAAAASQAHLAASPALVQAHTLVFASAVSGQTVDNVAFITEGMLNIASTTHASGSAVLSLGQDQWMVISPATHGHRISSIYFQRRLRGAFATSFTSGAF